MSKKARQMQAEVDRAKAAGTHRPAVECWCGTFHTPGHTHKQNDTGPEPKGLSAKGHNGA